MKTLTPTTFPSAFTGGASAPPHATDVIHALRLQTQSLEQRMRQRERLGVHDVQSADGHGALLAMGRRLIDHSTWPQVIFESAQAYTLAMCRLSVHVNRQRHLNASQRYAVATLGLGFHARAAEWHFWQGQPLPATWNESRLDLVDALLRADELLLEQHLDEVRLGWTGDLIRCGLLEHAQAHEFTPMERERVTELVHQLARQLPLRRQRHPEGSLYLNAWHGLAEPASQHRSRSERLNSLLLHAADIRKRLSNTIPSSLSPSSEALRIKLLQVWHALPRTVSA